MKMLLAILLLATISCGVLLAAEAQIAKAEPSTIIVPNNYSTIQAAVDNAISGDTIFVKSGTYNQSVVIDKSINLVGEKAQTTILTMPQLYNIRGAPSPPTYVINIKASNVNISNFTIINSNTGGGGINSNGNGNKISGILINFDSINGVGLVISGSNQTIFANHIANANTAIFCSGSYNQIIGNILLNDTAGITLIGSCNSVDSNSVLDGQAGIGISLINADSNTLYNNTIRSSATNREVCIYLANADSNIIHGNWVLDGSEDLIVGDYQAGSASSNLIAGNIVEGGGDLGILMGNGSYNVFFGNMVADNGGLGHDGYGVALGEGVEAENNLFFYNIFMNNSKNFGVNWQVTGLNFFDNGTVGNYWDDYSAKVPNASEIGDSGIGNVPYLVYGDVTDNYPLFSKPAIPDVVPVLPSPWSQHVSSSGVSSQLPSSNFDVPQFPSWVVLPLLMISVLVISMYLRRRLKTRKNIL